MSNLIWHDYISLRKQFAVSYFYHYYIVNVIYLDPTSPTLSWPQVRRNISPTVSWCQVRRNISPTVSCRQVRRNISPTVSWRKVSSGGNDWGTPGGRSGGLRRDLERGLQWVQDSSSGDQTLTERCRGPCRWQVLFLRCSSHANHCRRGKGEGKQPIANIQNDLIIIM